MTFFPTFYSLLVLILACSIAKNYFAVGHAVSWQHKSPILTGYIATLPAKFDIMMIPCQIQYGTFGKPSSICHECELMLSNDCLWSTCWSSHNNCLEQAFGLSKWFWCSTTDCHARGGQAKTHAFPCIFERNGSTSVYQLLLNIAILKLYSFPLLHNFEF